ncbi:hypothetical protein BCR42DRAFT_485407 [Absidia repens]|uniref:IMD domain-containing protein n=1 Tax=Absidia repens TaxID=90262 RepID=A0A1X2J042_9FUNG|nr:hypothetical protein BCR42DRAFT_485407 [Absidia repens]
MITNMTLSTPPISPLVTTLKKHQDDPSSFPRNSSHLNHHTSHLNHQGKPSNNNNNNDTSVTSSPSLFASLSTSTIARKAMSVMSSTSSYQYFGTLDESDDGATSIQSAPTTPEDYHHLSKHDLASVIDTHHTLLSAAQAYREQLAQLSIASANFGIALESVAKHKATMDAGQGLQAAAGLQLLISNHHQILAESMRNTFEIPLVEQIEEHQSTIKESQENYDTALQMISKNIREKEAANLQQAKKGQRDLGKYKRTLKDLTRQVDELDYIKTTYNQRMQDIERHYHQGILHQTGWLVRAQVDVYELLASKGLGDSTLESMIQQHPDPFNSYETVNENDASNDLFTVLPANSLIDPLPSVASIQPYTNNNIIITTDDFNRIDENGNGQKQENDLDQDIQSLDEVELNGSPTCFDHLQAAAAPFLYKRPSTDSFHRHIQQQQQQQQQQQERQGQPPLIKVPMQPDSSDISNTHDNKLD